MTATPEQMRHAIAVLDKVIARDEAHRAWQQASSTGKAAIAELRAWHDAAVTANLAIEGYRASWAR